MGLFIVSGSDGHKTKKSCGRLCDVFAKIDKLSRAHSKTIKIQLGNIFGGRTMPRAPAPVTTLEDQRCQKRRKIGRPGNRQVPTRPPTEDYSTAQRSLGVDAHMCWAGWVLQRRGSDKMRMVSWMLYERYCQAATKMPVTDARVPRVQGGYCRNGAPRKNDGSDNDQDTRHRRSNASGWGRVTEGYG